MRRAQIEALAARSRARIDRDGRTPADLMGVQVGEARRHLLEAMKIASRYDEMDLHRRVGEVVLEIDDLKAILAERGVS